MAIAAPPLTFAEFLTWDDGSSRSFELLNGVALPLSEPNAKHEDVVDGLCRLLVDHCLSLNLPYVPRQGKQVRLTTPIDTSESSRKADIVVFAREEWERMRQSSASAAAYAGLGGVQYIGSPKQPTVTIHRLTEGEYLSQQYQGSTPIFSPTFPQRSLTTQQVVAMTEI
jgi:Uma2 family endonuclease